MAEPVDWADGTVTVRLMGGLGNQLFQYSTGRAVAGRLGCELRVDVGYLTATRKTETPRPYQLEWLVPSHQVVNRGASGALDRLRHRVGRSAAWIRPEHVFTEAGFTYDPSITRVTPGVTLVGDFQSWRYFDDIADSLRSDLHKAAPKTDWYTQMRDRLYGKSWIAIHVRRGDYRKPQNEAFHGLLGPGYYQSALHKMTLLIPDGPLVIFSDEPDSALSVLDTSPREVVVAHTPETSHPMESIALMSEASGVIIANSSFSWWGAWLAGSEPPVVCPRPWFKHTRFNEVDLRPPSWMSVPSDYESHRASWEI